MGVSNTKRLVNLDLLRIVAMIMVVTLHYLGNEAILSSHPRGSLGYNIVWAIEIICIVAVNCYVLITGYFLSTSHFKIKKLIPLVAQMLFYSLGIYIVLLLLGKASFTNTQTLNALLPVPTGLWWFMSAYVGLYVLSPFLNKLIDALDQRMHLYLALVLVGLFSIWPSIFTYPEAFAHEGINIVNGYSITWFIVLYVVAAYIRRYRLPDFRALRAFFHYAAITVVSIATYILLAYMNRTYHHAFIESQIAHYISYNSLPVLLSAVALFLFFINLKVPKHFTRTIATMAPLTLGVYLLTEEPHIRSLLWGGIQPYAHLSSPYFLLVGAGFIAAIYLLASTVDFMRQILFDGFAKLHLVKRTTKLVKNFRRARRRDLGLSLQDTTEL